MSKLDKNKLGYNKSKLELLLQSKLDWLNKQSWSKQEQLLQSKLGKNRLEPLNKQG